MKQLLNQMKVIEQKMESLEDQAEYWLQEEHFDEEKSDRYEAEADAVYEELYKIFDRASEKIVKMTAGQIDKVTAMLMIRSRRTEVERIFA